MYFYISDDITTLCTLGCCAACVLALGLVYLLETSRVAKFCRRSRSERPDKPDEDYLPASVVVYSQADSENLAELLPALLGQNYPAPFEVIVVNEGESADVRDTVAALRASHHNLYLTFTPDGAHNLSRKKLAITLGVKAARYGVVVLTTSAAMIESPFWLQRMMRQFAEGSPVEVVLGFAYIDPAEDRNHGFRRRAFDYVADSVRWLAPAINKHPFRGTEYNIAYTKDVFLRNKGFARTLNLHYGDDDIFISEIANGGNTVVELSEDSAVRLRHGNHPRVFTERMIRRCFTESLIKRPIPFAAQISGWLQICALGTGIAAGITGYPNLLPATIAAVLILGMWAMDIAVWRSAMTSLRSRKLLLTLPWFSATYPLRRMWYRTKAKICKQKRYTWT